MDVRDRGALLFFVGLWCRFPVGSWGGGRWEEGKEGRELEGRKVERWVVGLQERCCPVRSCLVCLSSLSFWSVVGWWVGGMG